MSSRPKPSAVVFAKDMARLATFYKEVAEMTEVHRDADHVVLNEEGLQLVIHVIPEAIAAQIRITEPPDVRKGTPIKICLPVTGIAHARAKAAELGGSVGAKNEEWEARGFRACDGYDPEGNVFQVRESTEQTS
jgi:predicted enzyme related to lactoylglutathione lyase